MYGYRQRLYDDVTYVAQQPTEEVVWPHDSHLVLHLEFDGYVVARVPRGSDRPFDRCK